VSLVIESLKSYREAFESLGLLVLGIIGILILKYTSVLDYLEHHPDFDRILMLLIALFLEGAVALFGR